MALNFIRKSLFSLFIFHSTLANITESILPNQTQPNLESSKIIELRDNEIRDEPILDNVHNKMAERNYSSSNSTNPNLDQVSTRISDEELKNLNLTLVGDLPKPGSLNSLLDIWSVNKAGNGPITVDNLTNPDSVWPYIGKRPNVSNIQELTELWDKNKTTKKATIDVVSNPNINNNKSSFPNNPTHIILSNFYPYNSNPFVSYPYNIHHPSESNSINPENNSAYSGHPISGTNTGFVYPDALPRNGSQGYQYFPTMPVYCNFQPDTGFCRALFTSWYYDIRARDCLTFRYGGCDGNQNNFGSYKECARVCKV